MALDKSQIRIDVGSAPSSAGAVGSMNIRSDIGGCWIIVYNTHASDDLYVWPQFKGGTPIVIKAGTKRQLGYFAENNVLYVRSSTANIITYQVWSNLNKWDSSWFADETLMVGSPLVSGEGLGRTGDPLNPAGFPVAISFPATLGGRNARFMSVVPNVDIDLTYFINGAVAGSTVRILAFEGFSLGPDPYLEIVSISYVNVNALEDFEVRMAVY